MSLDTDFLKEQDKIIEIAMTKDIKEGDQLFVIGRNIYILPTVERTETGLKIYGTPIDSDLPLFTIELDFNKKKVKAEIKGKGIPSKYRVQIEKIVCENF